MKTVAYLRVSTGSQDLATQKLVILDFTQKRRFTVGEFIASQASSQKSPIERRIEEMLGTLQSGDRLLVSELSRLGRSLGQVLQIVATLIERKIRFIAIKEAIEVESKQDLRTKVMITLFGLFAEVERDLISERTKEGLAAAKAKGKLLGRRRGVAQHLAHGLARQPETLRRFSLADPFDKDRSANACVQSAQAHGRIAALTVALLVDDPDSQWDTGSNIVSTALLFLACVLSELEAAGGHQRHPKLAELWRFLRDIDGEAKDLRTLRYEALLAPRT